MVPRRVRVLGRSVLHFLIWEGTTWADTHHMHTSTCAVGPVNHLPCPHPVESTTTHTRQQAHGSTKNSPAGGKSHPHAYEDEATANLRVLEADNDASHARDSPGSPTANDWPQWIDQVNSRLLALGLRKYLSIGDDGELEISPLKPVEPPYSGTPTGHVTAKHTALQLSQETRYLVCVKSRYDYLNFMLAVRRSIDPEIGFDFRKIAALERWCDI